MRSLALTLDDAPSMHEPGVPFDAARMDRLREILTRRGVAHCVAFVVGERARGRERMLERWLDAGFELGNHTHAHAPASRESDRDFEQSLDRCDTLLRRVGAFSVNRPKWFRFPHLDRGRDPVQRARLVSACERLGYRIAPATLDLFDHAYEAPLAAALERGRPTVTVRVERRFMRTCRASITPALSAATDRNPIPQVAFAHFGLVMERNLEAVLDLLQAHEFDLCSLSTALDHPLYHGFGADLTCNGLVISAVPQDLRHRIVRRLERTVDRLRPVDGLRYGPLCPR
jgi:hypothetical protein